MHRTAVPKSLKQLPRPKVRQQIQKVSVVSRPYSFSRTDTKSATVPTGTSGVLLGLGRSAVPGSSFRGPQPRSQELVGITRRTFFPALFEVSLRYPFFLAFGPQPVENRPQNRPQIHEKRALPALLEKT